MGRGSVCGARPGPVPSRSWTDWPDPRTEQRSSALSSTAAADDRHLGAASPGVGARILFVRRVQPGWATVLQGTMPGGSEPYRPIPPKPPKPPRTPVTSSRTKPISPPRPPRAPPRPGSVPGSGSGAGPGSPPGSGIGPVAVVHTPSPPATPAPTPAPTLPPAWPRPSPPRLRPPRMAGRRSPTTGAASTSSPQGRGSPRRGPRVTPPPTRSAGPRWPLPMSPGSPLCTSRPTPRCRRRAWQTPSSPAPPPAW